MPFVPRDRYAELLTAESQLAALEAMFCESHMDTDVQNHNIGDGCLLCKAEPRFDIGQSVKWMGQDGPKVGTITRITHPENSGYVLWVGNDEVEDFPLAEFDVTLAL